MLEVPSQYDKELLYIEDGIALEQTAQGGCGFSILDIYTHNPPGCASVSPALGDTALVGCWIG